MEQIKEIKEYFDPMFMNLKDTLVEIKNHISQLYDKHDNNNDRIIKIESALEAGNKRFEHIKDDIEKVRQETIMMCNTKSSDIKADDIKEAIKFVQGFKRMIWIVVASLLGTGGVAGLIIWMVTR